MNVQHSPSAIPSMKVHKKSTLDTSERFVMECPPDVQCSVVFCSGSAGGKLVCGDVPAGSALRLSLYRARLLEGSDHRRGAHHYTRLHHDLRDLLQGKCIYLPG